MERRGGVVAAGRYSNNRKNALGKPDTGRAHSFRAGKYRKTISTDDKGPQLPAIRVKTRNRR